MQTVDLTVERKLGFQICPVFKFSQLPRGRHKKANDYAVDDNLLPTTLISVSWTVNAIIGNQAFSRADVIVRSGLCYNKAISNFFKPF